LTAEQPVSLALGTRGETRQASAARSEEELPAPDDVHAGLSGNLEVSVEACRACHEGRSGSASHPVNVYPTPGMIVPTDYPTLPDGRITCVSCHESHSSDHEYQLIKPQGRELCVGCHRNMR
jgi:predicted CXXCH cytochrome family protein